MQLMETELAYLAGFFDGEGCVLIYKRSSTMSRGTTIPYQIRATITNTDKQIIDCFRGAFGGSIYAYKETDRCRPAWKWTVQCQDAASFFRVIIPYLRQKRQQAELALKMQDNINEFKRRPHKGRYGQESLPSSVIAFRDSIHADLMQIRARRR